MKYVSTCSCGFVSEASDSEVAALDAYREHEQGHEPGQRTGSVERVNDEADADEAEDNADRPEEPAKPKGLRRASVPLH